ncbi:MAG: FeoA family protein [Crocinitomicaceae bacterium]|jgi:ferrous iron transport protein A|nr:ferrous iron transport protein A [Crocinitomicaceae bacterium]MDG1036037.1 FeoA family protein [Crocinitomicaceae bacterium]MDG1741562.1 FeoA family protein [Crocinitomicaceae bacterium]
MTKTLSDITNGSKVMVSEISQSKLRVKLMEMGVIKGRILTVLYRAPFGDPMAIDIDGYVLSLRKDEACLVDVELMTEL